MKFYHSGKDKFVECCVCKLYFWDIYMFTTFLPDKAHVCVFCRKEV